MSYSHITVEPLTPTIGAVISGVDLNNVRSPSVYEEIKQALWKHQVVFFRKQPVEPENYMKLGQVFGELEEHEFFPHVEGYPQIQTIAHEGYEQPETDRWHTDVTFRERPSLVSILRAVTLPEGGGDTMWASMAAAYEALPDMFKVMLLGSKAHHDLPHHMRRIDFYKRTAEGGLKGDSMMASMAQEHEFQMIKDNPVSIHPAVINHPVTRNLTLFVNSIWTKKFDGMHLDLSDGLLGILREWVKKPEFMVRFRWEPDSIAIWDNLATQHYAVFDYAPHYRAMNRMTAGLAKPELDMSTVPGHVRPPAGGASGGTNSGGMPGIVDSGRLAASSPSEQAAVQAIFNALDSIDLKGVDARARGV